MKTNYKNFVENLARQAGKIIRQNFSLGMKKEWKKDITPVTATDLTVNKLVLDAVAENFPDHGVIAEESSPVMGSDYVWVCDPVDGTIPFSHGVPAGIFLLALVKSGQPVFGVAYDPFLDRMFLAEKGQGATLNGRSIRVNQEKQLQGRSVVGLVHWGMKNDPMEKAFLEMNERWGVIQMCLCSIGYMAALVASGEFAAAVFQGRRPWDAAAVKLMVEEAGGRVTNLFGQEQRYDRDTLGFVASNGLVHDELVQLMKKYVGPDDLPK